MTKKKSKFVGVIDIDFVKYAAASAGETRSIIVKHLPTGREKEFDTRTDFKGRSKKKLGGWLGETNEERLEKGLEPFELEEFEITDKQVPEPLENVLHTVKVMVESAIQASGASGLKAYIGEGNSFRVERSTILEYKGNRKDQLKPLLLNDVIEYIKKKYNPTVVSEIESDDAVVMECYGKDDHFVIGLDKDFLGCPINYYDVNNPDKGIQNCNCFGELYLNEKNKVKGYGRMFFYFQVASGDDSDNYKANSASGIRWGEKSAYKYLKDCTNDKEALEALVEVYKHLYPEPKTITGWRGDEIEIDWMYVLNENWDLARMLRFEEDHVTAKDALDKLEVEY